MKRFLSSLRRARHGDATGAAAPEPAEPPAPARLTYAVGDIHGCLDMLDALLERIAADAGDAPHDLVFLGDYVDRGPDAAGVIDRLMGLQRDAPESVTCIAGNHDRMLLEFLADPSFGAYWMSPNLGGDATVASFGVVPGRVGPGAGEGGEATDAEARRAACARALGRALGEARHDWLATLPLWWRSGTLVAVHALTDPDLPMEAQDTETLVWARPGHDLRPRADGTWVVHGHTVVDAPTIRAGHVDVDTGACRGGALTAGVFAPGAAPRFVQVGG